MRAFSHAYPNFIWTPGAHRWGTRSVGPRPLGAGSSRKFPSADFFSIQQDLLHAQLVQFHRNAAQFREQFTYDVDREDLVLVAFYHGAHLAMHLVVDVTQKHRSVFLFAGAPVFPSSPVLWKENDIG